MIVRRSFICFIVCLILLAGFYLSLIGSAKTLADEKKQIVKDAIAILRVKGFSDEVFLLARLTTFRASDNWLNASVAKENAYAATNFPFEIITVYEDFFAYPVDEVERAAILLHEAKHLAGKNERDAYEFNWKNRERLGWTRSRYGSSLVWQNIRTQTRDNVPEIFTCQDREFWDCTEPVLRQTISGY